ncbi:unnamed protein product [Sphagnum jensenii]|uniref:Nuclear receptor corepressor 1 n=1 Tax=Sphagnum jensenii TaxID=128206 RepID=A0ABP0XC33_9BRYO
MYSPSRGDARATAAPNARDLSSSMPIDHVPTWQREPYSSSSSRDVRLDRGDRSDRGIAGKRDWNNSSDRTASSSSAAANVPFQRSLGLHHPANNGISLGPPNKRRTQGRHNSFYTEIGRYSAAASREGDTAPVFGAAAIQPLENGLGRKYDRDSFYLGTGAPPPLSPSVNGALGVVGQWHSSSSRESELSTTDGRDTGSSGTTTTGQNGRPYQSQALADAENLSWDRERSAGAVSGWDWSLKLEREQQQHRERLHSKPDLYSRRFEVPPPSQFDSGRGAWSAGDTELEGSRLDRYGSGNRESFSLDVVSGSRESSSHGSHDWRSRGERSASGIVPRGSPFISSNGSLKDSVVRGHGLEVAGGGLSSPQPSPHSAIPSGCHDHGHGRSHHSPPKRLRLGWGQGLAKYEKKKVGDVDESSLISSGVGTTTASVALPVAASGTDNPPPPSSEQTVVKETALSAVAKSPPQTTHEPSLPPPMQPVDNLSKAAGILVSTTNAESKDSSPVDVSTTCEQPVTEGPVLIVTETLPDEGEVAGWTKDSIIQRVEKVEFEIDQIEKEIARLEAENNVEILQDLPGNVLPVEAGGKENQLMAPEDVNSTVDIMETSPTLPLHPSPASPCSPAAEDVCQNSINGREVAFVEMMPDVLDMEVEEKAVGLEHETGDVAAPLEERVEKKDIGEAQQGEGLCVQSPLSPASGTEMQDAPVQVSMEEVVNMTQLEVDNKQELSSMVLVEDLQNFTHSLIMENKKQSRCASDSLVHLLTKELVQEGKGQLYSSPAESPMWHKNVESHRMNLDRIVEKLTEQQNCLKFKERVLTMRFRTLKDAWRQEQLRLVQRRYRAKPIRRWEIERRNGTAPPSQRSSLRLRSIQSDEELHAMKKLMCEPSVEQLRSVQKMPAMILDDKERMFRRFINTNALVEDPVLLELERKNANPWLPEEKKIFIDKFAIYNKNFSKIAVHLEHKTTADCVEFYYRNHKSEDFEKIRRRHQLKKRRDYTQASASYLATTAPGSSRHRDSNVARVEALNKAAAAAAAAAVAAVSGITTGTKAVRSSIHNRVVDRTRVSMPAVHPSSLLSVLDNINKTTSMKDNKAATSNVSSVTAAVPAVPAPSATFTTPCGLSSATPPMDAQWTDSERHLFTDAVVLYGKDFENIALHVGSKSESQCKAFFSKTRKRLGLDHLVEQYQAGVDGTAETAMLLQGLDLTQGHSEGTKVVVTEEDAKACLSNSKSAASSIKGETTEGLTVEVKTPKPESVDEESAGTADKPVSKTDEGLAETVGEHSVHESMEDMALLTVMVEDASKVAAQAIVVGEAVVLEESSTTKPEASTSTSIITGCTLLEPTDQTVKVEQCEEVCATQSIARVPGFATSGIPNEERDSESTKIDVLQPLSVMDGETMMEQATATIEKSTEMLAERQEPKGNQNIDVKPEPGSPQVATSANTDSSCLPPLALSAAQSTSVVLSTTVPIHSAQQFKEKLVRAGAAGDAKPRREPTSWTQDEKDKFAEIIRKHGKDWTRLHECLPAKSLTQIKTYFQNSKAKLGLVPSDGAVNSAGRGIGSRKRKADDSDTSSNNVGSVVAPINQHKAGPLLPPDVEIASQKMNPVMVPLPSMGTNAASADHLTYPRLGGQQMGQAIDQDSTSIQKLIQQMCSANGFPPNTPSSIFPFLHHSGLPIFPASGLQRAQNLQHLATSASQKQPLQSMIHQKLPSQSTGLVQQTNPPVLHQQAVHQQMQQTAQVVARNQQQLLQNQVVSMMQQAALRQQQQQQKSSQVAVHPLQQQVVGLQQQQQQQLLVNQHIVHHQQPQATSQQQQQVGVNLAQQVSTQGQQENNPPQQVVGQQQQHLHHQQQKALLQQQQMQQAVQQYHQHQQLQQQQQQQQQQDQALAQVQAHMQAQVLAIAQAQAQAQAHVQAQAQAAAAQVHAHVQEHEQASQHPPLTQPPRKPLTKIALQQQQQQKPLTKTVLQQQQQGAGLHHHHDQQQHGQSLGLLRGSIQALTPSSVTELSNQQVDMVELREAKLRHLCPEELQNQLSAVVQQASSAQQQQAVQPARPSPSSTVDAPQQIRPGDIKLFGQSLLSQPSLNVGPQSALHQAASSANERGALHQPFYPTLSAPSSTVTKPSGAPSAFGRVQAPFMLPEGRQASWPTLGSHSGNMGLWSMMNGLQGAATSLTKSSEREARSQHAMQETMSHKNDCFAQDSRELEGEQAMGALPLHLKHLEQLCSIQELRRNEGLAKMVPVSDQRGGGGAGPSVVIGVSDANQDSRVDTDKRCDHSQGLSSSTGQIDCYRRGDLSQGLSGANQIDGEGRKELSQGLNGANQIDDERRNELSQGGLSDPLMGSSNRATSESTGMQGVPSATSNQQVPRTVMDALIAIAEWQNSRSLPGHAPSGSVPQQLLEQQVWENLFRREGNNNGGSESVKTNPVFGLPSSLATTAHLSGPEVLQQCVRDSSMYFTPQHMLSLAGQRVNNTGAWNNGNRLMHTTESQLQMPMLPTITPFHSCPLSRGTTATDEHLRPVDSRGPDSTTGGIS